MYTKFPNVYELLPLTEMPTVIELDGREAWIAFECAIRESGITPKGFEETSWESTL